MIAVLEGGDGASDEEDIARRISALLPWQAASVDGFVRAGSDDTAIETPTARVLPANLRPFLHDPAFVELLGDIEAVAPQRGPPDVRAAYFGVDRHSLLLARWGDVLFYDRVDPAFIERADRVVTGLQRFAGLRLAQQSLSQSFFYPFIIIYAVMLVISLAIALLISERMSQPIRRLAEATDVVARGDWSYRLDVKASGETRQLVDAFNAMVSRIDEQSRRLVDAERIATWREIARYLAHEIKNPLLPIRLTAQELRDQYAGGDERFQKILEESTRVIGDEVDHLTRLVKEFSSFARMPELKRTRGSLRHLIDDVAKLYPQLYVRMNHGTAVPEFSFDGDQMRRVFVNLFDNVVAVTGAAPADAADMDKAVRVAVSTRRVGNDLTIEFTDNGPGMTPETAAKVFDPYFTTRSEGTGLGLAVVKSIVVQHGGSITVRSEAGKGAAFRIVLPMEDVDTGTNDRGADGANNARGD
jgi:nitrogen fixation/metabolism regulation signal transduction histidine kinase